MRGDSELRNGLTMRPPVLNADLDATVETGTTSTSLATLDNTRYLLQLSLHHSYISKFTSFLPSQFSTKYFSISLLQPRGEQNVTGANPTDQRRQYHPDSTADRVSRGQRLEGETRSDADAVLPLEL